MSACCPITRIASAVGLLVLTFRAATAQEIVFPGDTWEVVTPEEMFVDSAKLDAAIAKLPNSSRTMVIRNGRVIWQGSKVDESFGIGSITKAFASTALGLLIDDGKLTLDTPVVEFNPALGEEYADVTFRHLTTQTSNIQGNIFNPSAPYFVPSGSQFYYGTEGGNNALSHGIQVAAGQNLEGFLTTRIAEPTGMDDSNFDFQDATLIKDGERVLLNNVRGGLQTTANNVARFGLLFMNRGEWEGERLLSEDWVQTATTVQVGDGFPVHPASPDYTGIYAMGGWARLEANSFNSYGSGNSRLFVDPVYGYVVASLGNDSGPTTHAASDRMIAALYEAEVPLIWDEHGDGAWHDLSSNGTSRWLFQGNEGDHIPRFTSIVRHDRVTINQNLQSQQIRVESGAELKLAADRMLGLSELAIDSSTFRVDGRAAIGDITLASGDLSVSANGSLDSVGLTLSDQSKASLSGSVTISTLTARQGSEVSVSGPSVSIGSMNIRDSQLLVANGSDPMRLSGRTTTVRDSMLTFLVDSPTWVRTIILDEQTRRWVGQGSQLKLELDPGLDPRLLDGTELALFDWGSASVSEFEAIVIPHRIEADISEFYSTGVIQIQSVATTPELQGDFNGDELLNAEDINLLSKRIRVTSPDLYYDTDADGRIAKSDFDYWLLNLKNTLPGDANLDGQVSFDDFTTLQVSFGTNGLYAQGDFDLSGAIGFNDFLILSANFGETPAAISVPEPTGGAAIGIVILIVLSQRRQGLRRSDDRA